MITSVICLEHVCSPGVGGYPQRAGARLCVVGAAVVRERSRQCALRRPWISHRGGSVAELAENAGEGGAVCLAQPAEDPFGLGTAGGADRVEDAGAVLGHFNQSGPPIARGGAAAEHG